MTPQELLEKGMQYNDMDMINEAYQQLYGGSPELDLTGGENSGKIEEPVPDEPIIEIDPDPMDFTFDITGGGQQVTKVFDDGIERKACKREPINTKKISFNIFEDNGSEEKDNLREQGLYNSQRQPRTRKNNLVSAKCNVCGVVETVNRIHIRDDGYTCNKCLARRKRK